MIPDESPQSEPSSFIPSSTPWNITATATNSYVYPTFPNQYVNPIIAPGSQMYPPYWFSSEPPLTESVLRQIIREEIVLRQIIREEIAAYFDEGNDALSAPTPIQDITQEMRDHFDALHATMVLESSPLHEVVFPSPEEDTLS